MLRCLFAQKFAENQTVAIPKDEMQNPIPVQPYEEIELW